MSVDALCIGHASWDLCMVVSGFPKENSKSETEVLLESGGGPAANAAWLLSRWGMATAMAGLVGDDDYGCRIISQLDAAGVDCRFLQQAQGHPTPVSFIVVNRSCASRTIINRKSSGKHLELKSTALAGLNPKLLLLDGHELPASLAALEAFPAAITVLDAGSLREGTRELAQRVQYLVCSQKFATQFTGQADVARNWEATLKGLRSSNRQVVVMTLGEQGSVYDNGSRCGEIPALSVPARDTTAAGDVFHGAFAFALLRGMTLERALEFATVAAGLSVQKFGGRPSTPELAVVQGHSSRER